MSYVFSILIALDQLANAILGGWADETISARAHREGWRRREKLINALFFFQPNHCRHAYEHEEARDQLPSAYSHVHPDEKP